MNASGLSLATVLITISALLSAMAAPAGAGEIRNASTGSVYDNLDAALAASKDGDTIELASGTYEGNFTIGVPLTLRGTGDGGSKPRPDRWLKTSPSRTRDANPILSCTGARQASVWKPTR